MAGASAAVAAAVAAIAAGIAAAVTVVALGVARPALAASAPDDPARRDLLPSPPGVAGGSLGGFVNPAAWAAVGSPDFTFYWNDVSFEDDALDNWGLSIGGPLGFSTERRTFAAPGGGRLRFQEHRLGFAGGDRRDHWGVAWRWATGDEDALGRESGLEIGSVRRPARWLSVGAASFLSADSRGKSMVADVGIRPLGSPRLTLFADWTLTDRQRPEDGRWSAGAEIRPVRGVHLGARLLERPGDSDFDWGLNAGLTLDRFGVHALPRYDADGNRGPTTWIVRSNPPHAGLPVRDAVRAARGVRRWEVVDLENRTLTYQRDLWFDERRVAWIDLARRLRAIRDDDAVHGIALHLDGASVLPSVLWELRRELAACRAAGKEIVVHFDRVGMTGYYLASVADRIVADPNGTVRLSGVALQRTYQKGLLDKLGLGFEELRYFPYKTAVQAYSRTEMSPEDREQYGREVDVLYETIRAGVCEARGLTPGSFDAVVDGPGWLRAAESVDAGLVDELGRWADVRKLLREDGGLLVAETSAGGTAGATAALPDERWGRPSTIALVYARGECAMDEGIRGRATSAHLRRLAGRSDVAAVVLRADSPGGDRVPSDLVADGMRKVRDAKKPVVVTQGDVAASGGYWISMEADRVLTTPFTVTGSIGVISGWVWDDGFGGKTGLGADGVQRGAHADLFAGIRLPFLDARLPTRPLTEDERERSRALILGMYGEFVARVAEARGLTEDEVRGVGGGRVWMGEDAVARGLCDDTGTLADAVQQAAERAGVDPADVILEEYPPRRRFRLPRLFPDIPSLPWARGAGSGAGPVAADPPDYDLRYLRALAESPGEPLLFVPPEALPAGWGREPAP
jgi:protease-4